MYAIFSLRYELENDPYLLDSERRPDPTDTLRVLPLLWPVQEVSLETCQGPCDGVGVGRSKKLKQGKKARRDHFGNFLVVLIEFENNDNNINEDASIILCSTTYMG